MKTDIKRMETHIIGAMVLKLITQSNWDIQHLAQELDCSSELLYKCTKGIRLTRRYIKHIECKLARIYCSTFSN